VAGDPQRPDRPGEDADLDAAFAQIVAGWDTPSSPDEAMRWPASENLPPESAVTGEGASRTEPEPEPAAGAQTAGPPTGPPVPGPRDFSPVEPLDEHFVPPEPPPLPRGDLQSRLAWVAVLVGPAFLLVAGLFWTGVPRLYLGLAALAFVGGFVALVMRLPTHRDEDDDDGAVV
jgi:hypothetical protein